VLFAAQGQGGGSFLPTLFMMLLLFGAMYFLFIRPNKRRRQQMEEMQSSIGPGDEVMTIGGLYGTVVEIDDDQVVLEVAPGVTNRYTRQSINRVVTAADRPDEADEPVGPADKPTTSLDKVVETD
jgi:preprotein translocase subunit YajC